MTFRKMLKNYIRNSFYKKGFEVRKYPRHPFEKMNVFDQVMNLYQFQNESIFFIQIGGNDGILSDPIHKHYSKSLKWNGIIFEPNPSAFLDLEKNIVNYKNRIEAVNCAVSNHVGEIDLWVPENRYGQNLSAYVSNSRKILKKQIPKNILIEKISVESICMNDFLHERKILKIDLLQVDTEGHEVEILHDIEKWQVIPKILHIEIGHLSGKSIDELIQKISTLGYKCHWGGHEGDLICIK